ncbi:MAG: lipid-binding SYLF domain-containing protein [Bryobacterales bacterium]|nr:lipid-binding SYLF domain-containing protein [Bryobacterales bacterium]
MQASKLFAVFISAALAGSAFAAETKADVEKRLKEATDVLKEFAGSGDKGVPKDLLKKAKCAVIIPAMKKGGFIYAGQYGRGFASCKGPGGKYNNISAMRMEGGSFGLQVGGSSTDILMLVMNEKGAERLWSSKFTLGGEASAAAGPVGRDVTAQTDATMKAEILSYSRSQGIFGGISVKGSSLRADSDVNEILYGKKVEPKALLAAHSVLPPAPAQPFLAELNHFSR